MGGGGDDVHVNATLVSVSCVRLVLVCSGAVHWWGGGGVVGGDDVHANETVVFCFLWSVLVRYIGGEGGVGGVGGVMTSMRMRLLFSVSCVHLVLVCSGALHWWGWGVYR